MKLSDRVSRAICAFGRSFVAAGVVRAGLTAVVSLTVAALAVVAERGGAPRAAPVQARWVTWALASLLGTIALVNLAVAGHALRGALSTRRRARAARGEPWRRERAWPREVRPSRREAVACAAGYTLVTASLAFATSVVVEQAAREGGAGRVLGVALLAAVAVAWLVHLAAHAATRPRTLAGARLVLARVPFVLGEPLDATLRLAEPLAGVVRADAVLRCVEERRVSGPRWEGVVRRDRWVRTRRLGPVAGTREIPLTFQLPREPALASALLAAPPRRWELAFEAELAGGRRVVATFLVPVYGATAAARAPAAAGA